MNNKFHYERGEGMDEPDCCLDEVISLQVYGRSGLIQDQDLGLPEDGSGQADQLSLAHREVCAALFYFMVQTAGQLVH